MWVEHIWHGVIWIQCRQSKKVLLKSGFLLGSIYSSPTFGKKIVDPMCQLCQLGVEDFCYVLTRCPAFPNFRNSTVSQLYKSGHS